VSKEKDEKRIAFRKIHFLGKSIDFTPKGSRIKSRVR
jgi:hypothetical protein